MTRIFHTSDWHLGKSIFVRSLLDVQEERLNQLVREIELALAQDKAPHAVLIAGDIYDRSIPPEDAVRLLDRFLSRVIVDFKIQVAMIPGNHDSASRVGAHSEILARSGLKIFDDPSSIFEPLHLESSTVFGVPYLEPAEWGFFFQKPIVSHQHALSEIVAALQPQIEIEKAKNRRIVLLLHAFVSGGLTSDSERPLCIGGSELVSSSLLEDFDYVALGHLHRPQDVGSRRIRYSGSLFPYSSSEASSPRGYVAIELSDSRETRDQDLIEQRSLPFSRGLRLIKGNFQDLLNDPPSTDFVIAEILDSVLPFEAFRRLQAVHPHLLHVGRGARDVTSQSETEESERLNLSMREQRSDHDILADFLNHAATTPPTDSEREWLIQQLGEFLKADREENA